jgi:hypothetical protein
MIQNLRKKSIIVLKMFLLISLEQRSEKYKNCKIITYRNIFDERQCKKGQCYLLN